MQMADRMAADGYKDAGYTYVSIDVSGLNVHMKKNTLLFMLSAVNVHNFGFGFFVSFILIEFIKHFFGFWTYTVRGLAGRGMQVSPTYSL